MIPRGFLGTRADVLMDVCILIFTALPAILWWGVRLARQKRYVQHRNFQAVSLVIVLLLIVILETDIRLAGGTQTFLASSSMPAGFVRAFLAAHVLVAIGTAILWTTLALRSWRRFGSQLPGPFSATHRRLGRLTVLGVGLLSSSGLLLYIFLFVA